MKEPPCRVPAIFLLLQFHDYEFYIVVIEILDLMLRRRSPIHFASATMDFFSRPSRFTSPFVCVSQPDKHTIKPRSYRMLLMPVDCNSQHFHAIIFKFNCLSAFGHVYPPVETKTVDMSLYSFSATLHSCHTDAIAYAGKPVH